VKITPLKTASLISIFSILALSFCLQITKAQDGPLSLVAVATALQSKSSGMTLAQKNSFLVKRVQERGVTFRLTAEIEKELRAAGATNLLISAIRLNSPGVPTPTPTPFKTTTKPSVALDKLWVDLNVNQDDSKGMRIHTKLTVYNLKGVDTSLAVYFKKASGEALKTTNYKFSSTEGQVAVYRPLTPLYDATELSDLSVFIPYEEFNLPPGDYKLQLEAKLIYAKGGLIQELDTYDFDFNNPKPSTTTSDIIVTFDKVWIDYNITESQKLGMRVHAKFTVENMKEVDSQLVFYFEKQNGDKLFSDNSDYASAGGHTAVYRDLLPKYPVTVFNDLDLFVPYDEFNLKKGDHDLRVHADLIYPDGTLIKHLSYFNFRYSKK
jgi:hypothetical protein